MTIDFQSSIGKGKISEDIFKTDFLDFLGIKYEDVTNCQQFQIIDTDYLAKIGTYEIKTYKGNDKLCIEEYTNINSKLGKVTQGWLYKTKADLLVFVEQETHLMIFVPLTSAFKDLYESIKENHELCMNKISSSGERKWQSAFRWIPLDNIKGYYSKYRRVNG